LIVTGKTESFLSSPELQSCCFLLAKKVGELIIVLSPSITKVFIIVQHKRKKQHTFVANKKEDDCTSGEDKNDSVFPVTIKDEFIEDKKKKIT
jgi:hypothetical protein